MNLLLLAQETLFTPSRQPQLIPGVNEAIEHYISEGWHLVIVSNQESRPTEDAIDEMRYCIDLLDVEEAYLCLDLEGLECWKISHENPIRYTSDSPRVQMLGLQGQFRKPNPGMLKLAIALNPADEVLMVGDGQEDQAAAAAASIPFMWGDEWRRSH